MSRYKVLVHTTGKKDYENAGEYNSLEKAKEWVEWAKKNRDEKIAQGNAAIRELYEGLDWVIIDLGRK